MADEQTTNGGAVAVRHESAAMSLKQVGDRVNLVHQVLAKVMKKGTHFGTVPGCGAKMVLLKPGADVLAMTFRLVPQFAVTRTDLENGHREYDVTCSMYGLDGGLLGQGVGSASTMEKKYRYRKDVGGNKVENEDIADVYNTVLKIAKKRAHIDATLTVTGAADLFTQDLIDEDEEPRKPVEMPTAKAPAAPAAAPADNQHAEPGPSGDGDVIVTTLGKVGVKTGTGKRGDWARTYAKGGDGEWYSTFDTAIGDVMRGLEGQEVRIRYEQTEKGRNVAEIAAADAPAGEPSPSPSEGGNVEQEKLPF